MQAKDFPNPTRAETKLIDHLQSGAAGVCVIGGETPPENADEALHIRASLIRALILQQVTDVPLPERGLRIIGAYIRGDGPKDGETRGLDLEGADLSRDLALFDCHFPDPILLRSACLRNLYLNGSHLAGKFGADRLDAKGGVFLRNITAAGEIRLPGAKLGGDLDCSGATLNASDTSLNADGLEAKGGVFLRGITAAGEIRLPAAKLGGDLDCSGATLTATDKTLNADGLEAKGSILLRGITAAGEIRLPGAKLGGDLSCSGATLTATDKALSADGLEAKGSVFLRNITAAGEVRLRGAKLGGDLSCEGAKLTATGHALNAEGARIDGILFWREGASSKGAVLFTEARIGSICDDPACWPQEILLDRCRYVAFTGKGVSAADRIDWLSRMKPQKYGDDFWPQPYAECARVLREMGHGADARTILIEKERLQRAARHRRLGGEIADASGPYARLDLRLRRWLLWAGDRLVGPVVGYGRRPLQAALPLLGLLFIGAIVFALAAKHGQIKPNLPLIQRAEEWTQCADKPHGQLTCYLASPQAASYPRFNALIYSADTLLPIVNLEMQSYWIPDDRKPLGWWARIYLWLHIGAGWALTLLAVAGFSGLIKSDNST